MTSPFIAAFFFQRNRYEIATPSDRASDRIESEDTPSRTLQVGEACKPSASDTFPVKKPGGQHLFTTTSRIKKLDAHASSFPEKNHARVKYDSMLEAPPCNYLRLQKEREEDNSASKLAFASANNGVNFDSSSKKQVPPAHRWVRSASSARGSKLDSTRRINPSSRSAMADDTLTRSIRDIIRQRSREERVADTRTRASKRKCGKDYTLNHEHTSDVVSEPFPVLRVGSFANKEPANLGSHEEQVNSPISSSQRATLPVSMTPQVLVVDGQIVINENSLTVSAAVERATPLNDFTRVEESGSKLNSATYASYTKAEKWTAEDTELFFMALQQFGTDFSLIQRFFPARTRRQIKKKYLAEDKVNPGRIEAAIKNQSPDSDLYKRLITVLQIPASGMVRCELVRTVLQQKAPHQESVLPLKYLLTD